MAISSDGKLFASVTQVNTTSNVFCLFMSKLVQRLNKEDKNWQQNTIWLFDGAPYQTNEASQNWLKALGLNYVISAPYSYSAAPIELAFALLKSTHLNPNRLKTTKK